MPPEPCLHKATWIGMTGRVGPNCAPALTTA